jgi:hypothetical protein
MKKTHTIAAGALALVFGAGLIATPLSAQASEEGHRNTTYALGALSAFLLATQKNKLPGLLAAGGAAYAYSQWDKSIQERHAREAGYDQGYYRNQEYYPDQGYYRNGDYDYHRSTNYRPHYQPRYDGADYHRSYYDADFRGRHDNGKHKGWYTGNRNGWDRHPRDGNDD